MTIAFVLRLLAIAILAVPLPQDSTKTQAMQPAQQPGNSVTGSPEKPASEQPKQPSIPTKPALSSKALAWQRLDFACASQRTNTRATAVSVLGLLPRNIRARAMAEQALADKKPEVRSAAAASLGTMGANESIPKLRDATDDPEPTVVLAAAHSLIELHDHSGYEVYYEILTGERKGKKGLIASQTYILRDPKKMAELGIEEGIGFIPYGGMAWQAVKVIHEGDASPLRAAAAKVLIQDKDPETTQALEDALSDKHWRVRAAALDALAERDDPSVLEAVTPYLYDEQTVVKYTAAAAVLRLYAVKEARSPSKREGRRGKPVAATTP